MENKFNIQFSKEVLSITANRLTNQLWKLIPMYENNEDWEKQLDTVVLEIVGLKEIFYSDPQFLQLLTKLEGLKKIKDIQFSLYRKTVFECINLIQGMKNYE